MRTAVKSLLIALAALLALLLIAVAIVAATFNPNDYKPMLIGLVKDKTQRTLTIPGDIKLSFFPKIGAVLGKASLSARNSNAPFASIDDAKISLALVPLLSKRLVVDRVTIDGLRADITRFADGSTNFDDLLGQPAAGSGGGQTAQGTTGGAPLRFDIDGVRIAHAHLLLDDRQQGRHLELADLDLDTGRIATGVRSKLGLTTAIKADKPQMNVTLSANSGFLMEPAAKHYVLDGLDLELKGSAAGFTGLDAKLAGDVDIDKLLLHSQQLALTLSGRQGDKPISVSLTTPLSADLNAQHLELPRIAAIVTLPNPAGGSVNLKAGGNADVQAARHRLNAALKGSLDDSVFDAKLGMSSFSPAAYTFDIGIDRLDLDRYRAKPASGGTSAVGTAAVAPAAGAAKPIDLSALQHLQATGNLKIDALKVAGIHGTNVHVGVHAAGGRLAIDPLVATLYGGNASGAITLIADQPARYTMRETLSGIDLGPLLKDALGKQPLDGKGSVRLDVATSGASATQIKRGLNGSARIDLHDGAVRGINIAQAVREAKARIGELRGDTASQSGTANVEQKTDFSTLGASFRITNGVAHNDDLNVMSPLLRIGGSGDIDLGAERLDYLARVTVVSTLQGQGGPELQALKGLTVPVKLSGPFTSIGWRVDFAGLVNSLAKQKLDQEREEVKSKAQEALDKEKGKLQQQLQDRLKGLFGQ